MTESFKKRLVDKHNQCKNCPSNEALKALFEDIMSLLFPDFSDQRLDTSKLVDQRIESIENRLNDFITQHPNLSTLDPKTISTQFISQLEEIEQIIAKDVDAIYAGDPAAKSKEEVIRSYPGFYAIASYRIAHVLHKLNIKVIPRIITELAHQRTGIDIHPSAQIDHSFCIDHGTGIVIGETTIIGHHVKLYQGVTLGALSVNKEDANNKRHPTIEPHVVIYANATVLGGQTTIGEHSIIGANTWITRSVDAHSTVYFNSDKNQILKNN